MEDEGGHRRVPARITETETCCPRSYCAMPVRQPAVIECGNRNASIGTLRAVATSRRSVRRSPSGPDDSRLWLPDRGACRAAARTELAWARWMDAALPRSRAGG